MAGFPGSGSISGPPTSPRSSSSRGQIGAGAPMNQRRAANGESPAEPEQVADETDDSETDDSEAPAEQQPAEEEAPGDEQQATRDETTEEE